MSLEIGEIIYSGKAKDIYQTNHPHQVVIKFRDDITAGDGLKKDIVPQKGYYNSLISAKFFLLLEKSGIRTQFIELLEPGWMLAHNLKMIPLEVITRNIATGSLLKRFPFTEGEEFRPPLIQMDYKNDEFHDPMLNDDIILALNLVNEEELQTIREITLKINQILKEFLNTKGLLFPDFKIEYGYDHQNNIVLGDEISPDTCRFWDKETGKTLDKDIFRKGDEGLINAYKKIAELILNDEDRKRWNL